MSVINDPYQTFLNKGIKIEPIRLEIQKAVINGQINILGPNLFELTSGSEIPPFQHPVVFQDSRNQPSVCFDSRPYRGKNIDSPVTTNSRPEYELQLMRAMLMRSWVSFDVKYFTTVLDDALRIYISWIGSSIAKRFALNPNETLIIDILIGFYFVNLFNNEKEVDELMKMNYVARLTRVNPIYTAEYVESVLADVTKPIETVQELCELIKTVTGSVRLQTFNAGVLYTLIGTTWFGFQANAILSTAIEHVPTFYALIASAIKETLYRKTGFTQVVDNVARKSKADLLVQIENLAKNTY